MTEPSKKLLKKGIRCEENGKQTIGVAENEITRLCENLDIPDATQQVAKAIYRRSLDKKFIENRSIGAVSAASVYAAARVENNSCTLSEIGEICITSEDHWSRKDTIVQRTFSSMSDELDLSVGLVRPGVHVSRLVEELNYTEDVESKSKEIIERFDDKKASGKSPISLAASVVYMSGLLCNEKRSQREVADAANVTTKTISQRYQEIFNDIWEE